MKKLRVLKFGGSSVGSPEKIKSVASIVSKHSTECQNIVVVVSAMGDTTDELIDLAIQVSPAAMEPKHRREMDMLLTAGERISMSLLSMALSDLGHKCRSLTGSQSGIITDTSHGEARIDEIKPIRIREHLSQNEIVIVAGFQGVSKEKEITTLGRGGSDTSAVALGVVLEADEIFIYTDVSGFFTADPRIVKTARPHQNLDSDLAYIAATRGAQVLHPRCLELIAKYKKTLWVKNTFSPLEHGTLIKEIKMPHLESAIVKSVSHQKDLIYIRTKAASTAPLLALTQAGLRPERVEFSEGTLSFVISKVHAESVKKLLVSHSLEIHLCSGVTLVGYGFESHPEVLSEIQKRVEKAKPIKISNSSHECSILISEMSLLDESVRSLHELTI